MKNLYLALCLVTATLAQTPAPPKIQSPEVQPDGRVTFRYFDPAAQKVSVNIEGSKSPLPMQKDATGVWTLTTEPMPPDLYGYSFASDGAHRLDPLNTQIKPNLLSLSNLVHVPGSTPLDWGRHRYPAWRRSSPVLSLCQRRRQPRFLRLHPARLRSESRYRLPGPLSAARLQRRCQWLDRRRQSQSYSGFPDCHRQSAPHDRRHAARLWRA